MGTTADLLVIGAGPAGAAAAITAAGTGRRVVVVDRATFPRDKTCGDGLTTGALRGLEALGVPLDALGASAEVHDVVLVAPSGRQIRVPLPTHGRARPRDAADRSRRRAGRPCRRRRCRPRARPGGHGAEVAAGRASRPPSPTARSSRRRSPIAADGHYSTARAAARARTTHRSAASGRAFRQYFTGVDDPRLWVLFERDLLPGYAWVFPLPDGRANVGFGMLRGTDGDRTVNGKVLARTWRDLLTRPLLRDILGPPRRARVAAPRLADPEPPGSGPPRPRTRPLRRRRRRRRGPDDRRGHRAGASRPACWPPHATLDGAGDPDVVATRYRAAVDRALGRDLRFAARLQRVLAHPRGAELALRTVDLTPWTRRNFARWMFEDYPRAILFTPDRWQRERLHPPGCVHRRGRRW